MLSICQQAANGMVGTTQDTVRQHQVAACMKGIGITHVHLPLWLSGFIA